MTLETLLTFLTIENNNIKNYMKRSQLQEGIVVKSAQSEPDWPDEDNDECRLTTRMVTRVERTQANGKRGGLMV